MKKNKIFIILILIIIIILIFLILKKQKLDKINKVNEEKSFDVVVNDDEDTDVYEIKDLTTGEILTTTREEDDVQLLLDFYKKNPNIRINPPVVSSKTEND